jgi:hypothetical protein
VTWAPDYLTVAQLREYAGVSGNARASELADIVTSASRAVDRACRRQFGRVAAAVTRSYEAVYDRDAKVYRAQIADLQDVTGLTVTDPDGTAVAAADYTLLPVNAVADGMPYTAIEVPSAGLYAMLGLWGWSAVPAAVALAVRLQGSRWVHRRESPWGIAGSPDSGGELRLLARLDPDVETSLADYRRRWWAA